jgi:predicted HTH transcriptional regulator
LITKFEAIEQKIESHNHYLAESTLFRSKEVKQYDPITIRELLMNSIMHTDRSQEKFIEIEQTINSLRFENTGEYEFNSLIDLAQSPNQFKNYRNKTLSKFLFRL